MGKKSKAAVFSEVGKALEIRSFELPDKIENGAALCRITMSTICGSDLHTIHGKREEPLPLILGHEIIGTIVALGEGLEYDGFGQKLAVGDRVTWTIMASCGKCFYCRNGLPQKCETLVKYGHASSDLSPHLTGGYAEYIYLFQGTVIFKIPENISDEIATPANCALSTSINALETIELQKGETVLVQGAGLLGLNMVALAVESGAKKVFITDVLQSRLDLAKRFGANVCLNLNNLSHEEALSQILSQTGGYGVDVAIEVSGVSNAVSYAIQALRIGGRYLVAGLVTPGSCFDIDGNQITRKCLTIKGIHNYHPRHLGMALEFLEKFAGKYPFEELVGKIYPLSRINEAVGEASTGEFIRVGIRTL